MAMGVESVDSRSHANNSCTSVSFSMLRLTGFSTSTLGLVKSFHSSDGQLRLMTVQVGIVVIAKITQNSV